MKQNKNNESTNQELAAASSDPMAQDFKNAVLIVSIVANLTVFTAWVTVLVA